ncbi:mannose-6-phosphate isomerase, class I [Weissella halotolerans]|uniref:Mannose-6-phosphate isomerase n=1 Tax=Weissella halotolerans DSM 20190 TaxID=1123500 RepID=A0A0R2FV19_9LACO|nr:mannose-6-phosphate isomerase, class I [Weissella halotolerans]KRN32265.1 mannose-6-phosphate isomerase, class I [Weissella halotolerans DSM 20190]
MAPLFLTAALHEKIWGGTGLKDDYGFEIPSDHTGEAWVISGHPNGPTTVQNGLYAGKTLAQLWTQQPQLFANGDPKRSFPLLVKILDAKQDLSVQVHPDDAYAAQHAGELGKTESWYVLAAKPGAKIYYGHQASSQAEFDRALDQGDWEHLLQTVPVKAGDFFYVPAGTLHALGAGVIVLETQQSSDVTYRVYDFDRIDAQGHQRDLHLADAKAVTQVPFKPVKTNPQVEEGLGFVKTTLQVAPYFNVFLWQIDGQAHFQAQAPYTLVTVIEGSGKLIVDEQSYSLTKGMSMVLPSPIKEWTLAGQLTLVASTPGPKAL